MKRFLRIIFTWIIVSVILQCGVYLYLDKVYLKANQSIKDTIVSNTGNKVKHVQVSIPDDAKQITVSFDGKYVAFVQGSNFKVISTVSGQQKTVQFDKGASLSNYKWFPDVDDIIFAEKHTGKSSDILKFSSYNVSKNERVVIRNNINNQDDYVTLPDKNSSANQIEISPKTNMIYIKISNSGERNSIYSLNIMAQMEKARVNSYMIGDIKLIPHENKLVYEDTTYNKLRVTDVSNSISISNAPKLSLLGVDNNDNVYAGKIEEGTKSEYKISTIYYGKYNESTDKWKSINLNGIYDKKDIYITLGGRVFINDNLMGTVTEFKTGKKTSYKGQYLQMFSTEKDSSQSYINAGIASIDNGKLIITSLK